MCPIIAHYCLPEQTTLTFSDARYIIFASLLFNFYYCNYFLFIPIMYSSFYSITEIALKYLRIRIHFHLHFFLGIYGNVIHFHLYSFPPLLEPVLRLLGTCLDSQGSWRLRFLSRCPNIELTFVVGSLQNLDHWAISTTIPNLLNPNDTHPQPPADLPHASRAIHLGLCIAPWDLGLGLGWIWFEFSL